VLEQEWLRCAREQQPLALLMVDVDHFKRYNDAYGHPQGDACLKQVAAALKEAVSRAPAILSPATAVKRWQCCCQAQILRALPASPSASTQFWPPNSSPLPILPSLSGSRSASARPRLYLLRMRLPRRWFKRRTRRCTWPSVMDGIELRPPIKRLEAPSILADGVSHQALCHRRLLDAVKGHD
jgi:hypothetical protein